MSDLVHIGKILIEHGVLNEEQVFEILEAQRRKGVPFGVLAEETFDVTLGSIERAWIEQYHRLTGTIDLSQETVDESVLSLICRRQAWQFEMMPLRTESSGELIIVAGARRLARAVTFVANTLKPVVYFRVAQEEQLRELLMAAGITHIFVNRGELFRRGQISPFSERGEILFSLFLNKYLQKLYENKIPAGEYKQWVQVYEILS